jgi:hypothetical protein
VLSDIASHRILYSGYIGLQAPGNYVLLAGAIKTPVVPTVVSHVPVKDKVEQIENFRGTCPQLMLVGGNGLLRNMDAT